MSRRSTLTEQDTFVIYRKRGKSVLFACGGFGSAAVLVGVGLQQMSAQTSLSLPQALFVIACGVFAGLAGVLGLAMAALNTPTAVVTHEGIRFGGLSALFGDGRLVLWSDIASLEVARVRNENVLFIRIRSNSPWRATAGAWRHPGEFMWRWNLRMMSSVSLSDRLFVMSIPEIVMHVRQRFGHELREHHVKVINA